MTPLVSIIIPTFNYAFCIAETIKCLQDQLYQNWEAIIIDDGSTDDTKEVVSKSKHDLRINYFYQANNGVSVARNKGLELSKGEYIQFLDADDLLSPHKLSSQVEYMENNPSCEILYSTAFYFDHGNVSKLYRGFYKDKTEWIPKIKGSGMDIICKYIMINLFPINSALVRSSSIHGIHFDKSMRMMEDWNFWFECALHELQFEYQNNDQSFVLIRLHTDSVSQNRDEMYKAIIDLMGIFRDKVQMHPNKIQLIRLINIWEKKAYKKYIMQIGLGCSKEIKNIYHTKGSLFTLHCYIKAVYAKIRN